MIHYYLNTDNGLELAKQLDNISACAQNNHSMISDIENHTDALIVEINSLEFNVSQNKFEDNIENTYYTLISILYTGLEPTGLSQKLLSYMVNRIDIIKEEIKMLDDACLNSTDENEMEKLNNKFLTKTKLLNLIYKLSSKNTFINPKGN
jgi:hypothetical protein